MELAFNQNPVLESDEPLSLTPENALILGEAFWNIARLYELGRKDQAILLGMNPDNRQALIEYEKKKSIPLDPDKFFRIGLLLGIHKNLRILYPENREIVYNWMTTKQEAFGGKTPMEFIAEHPSNSLMRLATVRRYLDIIRTTF